MSAVARPATMLALQVANAREECLSNPNSGSSSHGATVAALIDRFAGRSRAGSSKADLRARRASDRGDECLDEVDLLILHRLCGPGHGVVSISVGPMQGSAWRRKFANCLCDTLPERSAVPRDELYERPSYGPLAPSCSWSRCGLVATRSWSRSRRQTWTRAPCTVSIL